MGRRLRVDRGQCLVPELGADYAGLLQALPLARCQRVQRGLQHAYQRGGHLQVLQPVFLKMPPIVCGLDDAAVHQHLQQRFHVVRIARGLAGQQRLQLRRRFGHALQ